jgi:hypothetical protein
VLAEADDALDPGRRGGAREAGELRIVASAISSTDLKNSRCTGAMVVMIATSGRTSFVNGVISPAWFMPISNTPKRAASGRRASDRGTPQ